MRAKQCSKCHENKRLSAFGPSDWNKARTKRQGDGHRQECKACQRERKRQSRGRWTPERTKAASVRQQEIARQWDSEHPHSLRARRSNLSAKRRGAKDVLTEKDVALVWDRFGGKCWVCGRTATEVDHYRTLNKAAGGTNTPDNIRPVCRYCNQRRLHQWRGVEFAEKEAKALRELQDKLMPEYVI